MPESKPRLLITHMELENFKSYANLQTIGPFHHRFSSVVGPNGSGKSNVIDAMMFVFGKRAKQMRLAKVSELIHKSEQHPNFTYARVSVFFQEIIDNEDDEDGFEVVEGSELVVTRIAHKDNSSTYKLNNKTSNFTDVQALLKGKGIDLDHNRFLILQGEVEQISLMKPKAQGPHDVGLLEYLEDIIGSNKYVDDIAEANSQLESAQETRALCVQRARAAERDAAALAGSREEAEEFLRQEQRLRQLRGLRLQQQLCGAEEASTKAKQLFEEIDDQLKSRIQELTETQKGADSMEEEYQSKRKEWEALEAALESCRSDFDALERRDVQLKERAIALRKQEKKALDTVAKEKKKAQEEESAALAAEEAGSKAEDELPQLRAALDKEQATLDALVDSLEGETVELREQLEAAQAALLPLATKAAEARAELEAERSAATLLRERAEEGSKKYEQAQAESAAANAEAKAKKNQAVLCAKQVEDCHRKSQTAKKELAVIEEEAAKEGKEAAKLSARLESARSAQGAAKQRGAVMQALISAKQRGKLDGIVGRLGDLGRIDAEYDIAISTACPQLNHVVVETTEAAQRAVQFLRANKVGVATFVILEKVNNSGLDKAERAGFKALPQGARRLFDLVKPYKDQHRMAFYFALRDTLVTPDLDGAVKLAFAGGRRNRVVTQTGQLIDSSGAMSGGGKAVVKGGMSAGGSDEEAADPQQVAAWEREAKAAGQRVADLRKKAEELENSITNFEKVAKEAENSAPRLELEAEAASQHEQEILSRLPTLKAEAKLDPSDVKRLQQADAIVAQLQSKVEAAEAAEGKGQSAVDQITAAMEKVGGSRLRLQKVRLEAAQNAVDEAESALAKMGANANKRASQRARKALAAAETKLESVVEEVNKLKSDRLALEEESGGAYEALEQAQTLLTEKETGMKAMEEGYEKVRAKVRKSRQEKQELQEKTEAAERSSTEAAQRVLMLKKAWDKIVAEAEREQEEALKVLAVDDDEDVVRPESAEEAGSKRTRVRGSVPQDLLNDCLSRRLSAEEIASVDGNAVEAEAGALEHEISESQADFSAIERHREAARNHRNKLNELEGATSIRDNLREKHDDLRKKRLEEFMQGFSIISMRLKEMYQMITLGGDAELELVDSLDPFTEGVVFSVRPPKKAWKNISNLSGGEKTLSSLALVFALHYFKPTPLYVMDEIDAALDFQNVSIVAHYIKERTKDAQFVIISLRNNMFELADRLVGIYKTHNATKSVAINPQELAHALGPQAVPASA